MTQTVINDFCEIYQKLNKDNLSQLGNIYDDNVIFEDAVHRIQGLGELHDYFQHLYHNLSFCQFDIEQVISQDKQASIIWTMTYAHKKLKSGREIKVNGCSHLKFSDKIYYHRDYLDMGQMLYEHLPVLGGVIRLVKKRVSQ